MGSSAIQGAFADFPAMLAIWLTQTPSAPTLLLRAEYALAVVSRQNLVAAF